MHFILFSWEIVLARRNRKRRVFDVRKSEFNSNIIHLQHLEKVNSPLDSFILDGVAIFFPRSSRNKIFDGLEVADEEYSLIMSSTSSVRAPKICRNFSRAGTCRFGQRCRFQHTSQGPNDSSSGVMGADTGRRHDDRQQRLVRRDDRPAGTTGASSSSAGRRDGDAERARRSVVDPLAHESLERTLTNWDKRSQVQEWVDQKPQIYVPVGWGSRQMPQPAGTSAPSSTAGNSAASVTRSDSTTWENIDSWEYIHPRDEVAVVRGPYSNVMMRGRWIFGDLPKTVKVRPFSAGGVRNMPFVEIQTLWPGAEPGQRNSAFMQPTTGVVSTQGLANSHRRQQTSGTVQQSASGVVNRQQRNMQHQIAAAATGSLAASSSAMSSTHNTTLRARPNVRTGGAGDQNTSTAGASRAGRETDDVHDSKLFCVLLILFGGYSLLLLIAQCYSGVPSLFQSVSVSDAAMLPREDLNQTALYARCDGTVADQPDLPEEHDVKAGLLAGRYAYVGEMLVCVAAKMNEANKITQRINAITVDKVNLAGQEIIARARDMMDVAGASTNVTWMAVTLATLNDHEMVVSKSLAEMEIAREEVQREVGMKVAARRDSLSLERGFIITSKFREVAPAKREGIQMEFLALVLKSAHNELKLAAKSMENLHRLCSQFQLGLGAEIAAEEEMKGAVELETKNAAGAKEELQREKPARETKEPAGLGFCFPFPLFLMGACAEIGKLLKPGLEEFLREVEAQNRSVPPVLESRTPPQ